MERLLRSPETVDVLQFCDWPELGCLARTLRLERSPLRTLLEGSPETLANYTEGVTKPRPHARLRLHEVVGKAPGEVIVAVLAAYPEAARWRDGLGRLPIFYAATNGRNVPPSAVKALIDAYPEAVLTFGSAFSLSYLASTSGSSMAVVTALQDAEMRAGLPTRASHLT
jgi:hypothetical protein